MWQIYALLADDLIRDRRAEAEAEALYRALLLNPDAPARSSGPGVVRRASVALLRRVETAAAWISRRACSTATRLEGEPA